MLEHEEMTKSIQLKFGVSVLGVSFVVAALCLVYFKKTSFYAWPWRKHAKQYQGALEGIWPKSDNDPDDRLMSQLRFMETYRPRIFDADPKSGLNGGSGSDKRRGKMKVILSIGEIRFKAHEYKDGQQMFIDKKCPVNTCWVTRNDSAIPTADALLIIEFNKKNPVSKYLPKPPKQIWIAHHLESPHLNRIDPDSVKDLINWTTTYRRSSTIPRAYERWERKKTKNSFTPGTVEHLNYAAGKTKKICMLVSNCKPKNNRMQYARDLQKYMAVDIYGRCGDSKLPRHVPSRKEESGMKAVEWLSKRYKFILAFENAICKDYITEKLLTNSLSNNILPIVLGASREDYAAAAPPHSYIHVDDFSSPQHLAQYLDQLDKNDTLYNEYFAWKFQYYLLDQGFWCRICMLLHLQEEVGYRHWYPDYSKWWNPVCSNDTQGYYS